MFLPSYNLQKALLKTKTPMMRSYTVRTSSRVSEVNHKGDRLGQIEVSVLGDTSSKLDNIHLFYYDLGCFSELSTSEFLTFFCEIDSRYAILQGFVNDSSRVLFDVSIENMASFSVRVSKERIEEISWHLSYQEESNR